jgi:mannose-6-phosphate isomerase-like protein (cupin superfamily)
MPDVTVKRVEDMEAIFFGSFKRAGAELEVESFGLNVIDFPPDAGEQYPEHDHNHDEQEEVFVAIKGSGKIVIDEGAEEHPLDADTIVRVGPTTKRKIWAGPEGMRLLALGGVRGRVYERPEPFRKGVPDPTQQPAS